MKKREGMGEEVQEAPQSLKEERIHSGLQISVQCTSSCCSSSSSYEEKRYSVSRLQGRKRRGVACREREREEGKGQARLSGCGTVSRKMENKEVKKWSEW